MSCNKVDNTSIEYVKQFADSVNFLSRCNGCNQVNMGRIDLSDRLFYCNDCWNQFLISHTHPSEYKPSATTKHNEYLVFGYINTIENGINFIVPIEVKNIIFYYYGLAHWLKSGKALRFEGRYNGKCIRDKWGLYESDYQTAFGVQTVSSGCHYWRFKVNKMYSCSLNMVIGIIDSNILITNDKLNKAFNSSLYPCHALIGGSGDIYYCDGSDVNGAHERSNYAPKLKVDDVVGMCLDFDQQTVSFVVNGIEYQDLKLHTNQNTTYRMAVSLYGGPNEIELLGYTSHV